MLSFVYFRKTFPCPAPSFQPRLCKRQECYSSLPPLPENNPLETQVPTDFLSSQRAFPHAIARGLSQAESPGILPLSASHLHPGSDSQRAPALVVRQTPLTTLALGRSRERCLGITVPPSFNAWPAKQPQGQVGRPRCVGRFLTPHLSRRSFTQASPGTRSSLPRSTYKTLRRPVKSSYYRIMFAFQKNVFKVFPLHPHSTELSSPRSCW